MADHPLLGRSAPAISMPVEAGKIAEFARATLTRDPVYTDRAAAEAQGLENVAAPLTFTVSAALHPGADSNLLEGIDLKRVLAGGAEWEFFRPLVAGETLTLSARIADVQIKQGKRGPMTVITREVSFHDEAGALVQVMRSNILEMPPREEVTK